MPRKNLFSRTFDMNATTEDRETKDDAHTNVLKEAFESLNSRSGSKVIISYEKQREAVLNRDLLILFSGFLRDVLASVPQCPSNNFSSYIIIPDLSVSVIMRLQDLLTKGHCEDVTSVEETKEILDAFQLLGIDIQKIHYERLCPADSDQEVEVCLDLTKIENQSDRINKIVEQKKKEEKRIAFITSATNNMETLNVGETDVEIKKEPDSEPVEDAVMEEPTENSKEETFTPDTEKDKEESSDISSKSVADVKSELTIYECEECKKPQTSLLNLKKHLCIHFMSVLKKNFAQSYDKEKCLLCNTSIPSLKAFLLHAGIHHDKLNSVLKMKGMTELPPLSASKKAPRGLSPLRKATVTPRKVPGPSPQHLPTSRGTNSPSVSMSASTSTSPAPPQTPVQMRPSAEVAPASERKPLDSECNFNLTCQVCEQRMVNLHQLEQHLCRHFMKELQESCNDLVNDMKCTLCYNEFKQKHNLLLHLGCKHGKINDILREKNLKVLPAPILNNPTTAMQKKLKLVEKKVKKEREETRGSSNSGVTLNEASTAPSVPAPPSTNFKKVKKFQKSTRSR